MRHVIVCASMLSLLLVGPRIAGACHLNPTCTAGTFLHGSNTYVCDILCFTESDCASTGTFANCDQCGAGVDNATPDGKCTICNVGGHAATINGTSGADVICGGDLADTIDGKGGNDVINARAGDDVVNGGGGSDDISGGAGNDNLSGGDGDDTIIDGSGDNFFDGGNGADTLWAGAGDDTMFGGNGNDLLIGGGGSDYLNGGDDNDTISTLVYGATVAPDDDLGSRYCGGPGNDNIQARGAAHQCMDGGPGSDTCGYGFWVSGRSPTNFDVGTAADCENSPGVTSTRHPDCGCP